MVLHGTINMYGPGYGQDIINFIFFFNFPNFCLMSFSPLKKQRMFAYRVLWVILIFFGQIYISQNTANYI